MAKIADIYYKIHPFKVIEEGFDKNYSEVSESIFSLGNEYMGVRGYFEEGYSGEKLIGNYFNGIYEKQEANGHHYKGVVKEVEFMVNSVDWLYTRILIDEEVLDLNKVLVTDFKRDLDLRNGLLTRSFIWNLKDDKKVEVKFERFVSMKNSSFAGQRISLKALNFEGKLELKSGLDFSNNHQMSKANLWDVEYSSNKEKLNSILGRTKNTNQGILSIAKYTTELEVALEKDEDKKSYKVFTGKLKEGKEVSFEKVVKNVVIRDYEEANLEELKLENEEDINNFTYNDLFEETTKWWNKTWLESDISIEGDELNQQGIRFCIFQMHQTYHGAGAGNIIGAKGLTGEAYSGNSFWDTEVYCLAFYLFNNVEAAKQLLEFRYLTLEKAKERAKDLDCEGAFYPIATISGSECCSLWQHASLQLQASTAVAYGLWHYENVTGDSAYIAEKGLEILVEVSRMLATRGDWNASRTKYGYYGVMGPDEFQMMVNHNCYTNYMGKFTIDYTLEKLEELKNNEDLYKEKINALDLKEEEIEAWKNISDKMYIPFDEETKIYEQHEGYFDLPYLDVDKIPVEEFPLYNNWTYDRIYRNSMIKQPDVLMLMLLFNDKFSNEELKINYEYYEPRCIHESSLSPSVHSILAKELKKYDEAYNFFGFATRLDLDNYNRNTREGLHTTSIAGAWMNILYGFAGMRSDSDILKFSPSIPKEWTNYTFRLRYKNDVIVVTVNNDKVKFETLNNSDITIKVYDEIINLKEALEINIPTEWRI